MLKNYLIEHENGITRIQFSKKPAYSEVQAVIDDIVESFPYEKRLWNLTNIQFDFTMDEIKSIAEYGKLKFIKPNKLAIVADDNWAYSEMKIFEAHRKQEGISAVRAFRTEQEALEWLNQ